jgi:hypothetical protein
MQISKCYPKHEHFSIPTAALLASIEHSSNQSHSVPSLQQLLNLFGALIDNDNSLIVQQLQLSELVHTSHDLQQVRERFVYTQQRVKELLQELEPLLSERDEEGEIEQIIGLQERASQLVQALQQLALSTYEWANILRRSP